MAFLEAHMVQVREIIRRWQAGENKTAIGRASGVSARTVGRYIAAAMALDIRQDGEPPPEESLARLLQRNHPGPLPRRETPAQARLAGHEEQVARWLQEEQLQLTRVKGALRRPLCDVVAILEHLFACVQARRTSGLHYSGFRAAPLDYRLGPQSGSPAIKRRIYPDCSCYTPSRSPEPAGETTEWRTR